MSTPLILFLCAQGIIHRKEMLCHCPNGSLYHSRKAITPHMDIQVVNECRDTGLIAGVAIAQGVKPGPSSEDLSLKLQALVKERVAQDFPSPEMKSGIRSLLKKGGFKPTGRNKPASEYLAQAAREERFPFINNLVDVNNYISLLTGLPVSLLDLDKTGRSIVLRTGKAEEKYVFNTAGQIIDVEGLISICRADGAPLGNPVKDSMEAKIGDETKNVIGVIYSSNMVITERELVRITHLFADFLNEYGGAAHTEVVIV